MDENKQAGLPTAFRNSIVTVQGFVDKDHGLLTYDLTVPRSSQRILLSFAACSPSLFVFSRDVRQAYTQLDTKLSGQVYIHPPSILTNPSEHMLCLLRPLLRSV